MELHVINVNPENQTTTAPASRAWALLNRADTGRVLSIGLKINSPSLIMEESAKPKIDDTVVTPDRVAIDRKEVAYLGFVEYSRDGAYSFMGDSALATCEGFDELGMALAAKPIADDSLDTAPGHTPGSRSAWYGTSNIATPKPVTIGKVTADAVRLKQDGDVIIFATDGSDTKVTKVKAATMHAWYDQDTAIVSDDSLVLEGRFVQVSRIEDGKATMTTTESMYNLDGLGEGGKIVATKIDDPKDAHVGTLAGSQTMTATVATETKDEDVQIASVSYSATPPAIAK